MRTWGSEALLIELTSADAESLLSRMVDLGVSFRHVNFANTLTVKLEIRQSDLTVVRALTSKQGGSLKIINESGVLYRIKQLSKRPLLIIGIAIIMILGIWLPTRVLFITVDGNDKIPDRHIIEKANKCGISFGASRREVRSEKMKNSLLSAIPSLQWAGINTSGCTAVISVKERSQTNVDEITNNVSSIVAVRDGVIESCISEKGNLLCKIGQAVKQGDVLISGYTDCGIKITAARAEGEVFAQTKHSLTIVTPFDYTQKGEIIHSEKKYGMLIGKKRINFYKGSGISDTSCDKIYSEYYVTLPGGFRLPVAFTVSIFKLHDRSVISASTESVESTARVYAQQYLLSQMISGRILNDASAAYHQDDVCILEGNYVCSEMIGRVQVEEIIGDYGEDD